MVKTQSKINTKIISQYPLWYPPYSNNEVANTGSTKHFVMTNTLIINKKKAILHLHVQLPNGTVLTSTHKVNLQLATIPKELTKDCVF